MVHCIFRAVVVVLALFSVGGGWSWAQEPDGTSKAPFILFLKPENVDALLWVSKLGFEDIEFAIPQGALGTATTIEGRVTATVSIRESTEEVPVNAALVRGYNFLTGVGAEDYTDENGHFKIDFQAEAPTAALSRGLTRSGEIPKALSVRSDFAFIARLLRDRLLVTPKRTFIYFKDTESYLRDLKKTLSENSGDMLKPPPCVINGVPDTSLILLGIDRLNTGLDLVYSTKDEGEKIIQALKSNVQAIFSLNNFLDIALLCWGKKWGDSWKKKPVLPKNYRPDLPVTPNEKILAERLEIEDKILMTQCKYNSRIATNQFTLQGIKKQIDSFEKPLEREIAENQVYKKQIEELNEQIANWTKQQQHEVDLLKGELKKLDEADWKLIAERIGTAQWKALTFPKTLILGILQWDPGKEVVGKVIANGLLEDPLGFYPYLKQGYEGTLVTGILTWDPTIWDFEGDKGAQAMARHYGNIMKGIREGAIRVTNETTKWIGHLDTAASVVSTGAAIVSVWVPAAQAVVRVADAAGKMAKTAKVVKRMTVDWMLLLTALQMIKGQYSAGLEGILRPFGSRSPSGPDRAPGSSMGTTREGPGSSPVQPPRAHRTRSPNELSAALEHLAAVLDSPWEYDHNTAAQEVLAALSDCFNEERQLAREIDAADRNRSGADPVELSQRTLAVKSALGIASAEREALVLHLQAFLLDPDSGRADLRAQIESVQASERALQEAITGFYAYLEEESISLPAEVSLAHLDFPPRVNEGEVFEVRATLRNVSDEPIEDAEARFCGDFPLTLMSNSQVTVGTLPPGEEREVSWQVRADFVSGRTEVAFGILGFGGLQGVDSFSSSVTITPRRPPIISALSPTDGSTVDTGIPLISASIQDTSGEFIDLLIDGFPVGFDLTEDFTIRYNPSQKLGGTSLKDGLHTVVVRAANRPEEPVYLTWSFTVRTSEEPHPLIHNFSPAAGQPATTATPTLSAQVQGDGAAVGTVRMYLDGETVNAHFEAATGEISYLWGMAGGEEPLSAGPHSVLVEATDARGITEVASWVFWVEAPESE